MFNLNLYKGLKNNSVINLQQFLRELGLFTYPTNTSYYGTVTEEAVQKFQCENNIVCEGTPYSTGYGVVGPKTREALNKAYSLEPKADSSGTTPTGTTGTETPSVETPSEAQQVTQLQQQISDLLKMVEELQRQLLNVSM